MGAGVQAAFARGELAHRATSCYRPTPEQVAHVRARWVTSAGPGSTVPANRSDLDHLVDSPHGQTIVTNLAPSDRTWHNRNTRGSLRVSIDHHGASP